MTRHENRLDLNNKSRNKASHFHEEWSHDEVDFLMVEFAQAIGDADQEALVAEILGRTIEGCRQRFYEVRSGKKPRGTLKVTSTTATTIEYIGALDDDEDRWWDPSYYQEGK